MKVITRKPLALLTLVAACTAFSSPAGAVDQTVEFGAPTVLSAQGQRLKVVLPVKSAPNDWATAASFMVRETHLPQGHEPLPPSDFTVMRPAASDYVVFQSGDIVRASVVSLIISVAGEPRSPYRMDLQVPQVATQRLAQAAVRYNGRNAGAGLSTRKIQAPAGEAHLPPK